jgi:hypothetical protein
MADVVARASPFATRADDATRRRRGDGGRYNRPRTDAHTKFKNHRDDDARVATRARERRASDGRATTARDDAASGRVDARDGTRDDARREDDARATMDGGADGRAATRDRLATREGDDGTRDGARDGERGRGTLF